MGVQPSSRVEKIYVKTSFNIPLIYKYCSDGISFPVYLTFRCIIMFVLGFSLSLAYGQI
jgi:hypothetical protein